MFAVLCVLQRSRFLPSQMELQQCREGCVNTTPNPRRRRTPAHVIFSRVAQDLGDRVNRNRCVSQNSHSSHPAQHVAHALVVVTFTLEHHLTFPHALQSDLLPDHLPDHLPGDLPCADPSNVSFGPLAETHTPTGCDGRRVQGNMRDTSKLERVFISLEVSAMRVFSFLVHGETFSPDS